MKMDALYSIGDKTVIGSYEFTKERILDFATKFDPQPFHVDEDAAKQAVLGGLCASGWHTAAAWMRTYLAYYKAQQKQLKAEGKSPLNLGPSPGFKNLRWIKPVYAGDVVTYAVTYRGTRPLASRPGWSIVSHVNEGVNQNGDLVFSFEGAVLEFD